MLSLINLIDNGCKSGKSYATFYLMHKACTKYKCFYQICTRHVGRHVIVCRFFS